jgi:hypothetical protein
MSDLKIYHAVLLARSNDSRTAASIYGVHKSIEEAAKRFYDRGKERYPDSQIEVLWESIGEIHADDIAAAGWVRKPEDAMAVILSPIN